ncbi:RICIN domain-containing protein [Streptomyces sp. CS131]|uniref:RICIN domain-containing protein n=1 Tax=Streptomyces sp. CS131 TaxID=2162711 RepID=UPI000D51E30B|nr:RICIN domain-containing protein [Streptomyces sp. CS131]PVC76951.1 hypothetical protein DBP20_35165 [Streptomyces sp. CS131]
MTNIEAGVYRLVNAKSGTYLTVGTDGRTVEGNTDNGERSKWALSSTGPTWLLRSVGTGGYLALDGGQDREGTALVTGDHPGAWGVAPVNRDSTTHRLFPPGNERCHAVLTDGDSAPGTSVTLWAADTGKSGCWRFEAV